MGCLVIAHRGASHDHPENTLAAFAGARDQRADWVELDVRRAGDGSLVVHHDPHLADGRAIVTLGRAELPPAVPTLEEALAACRPLGVNVEIKNIAGEPDFDPDRTAVPAVLGAARAAGLDVLVSSFDPATVEACRSLDPDLAVALLVHDPARPLDAIGWAAARGVAALHPWAPFVDRALVGRCHDEGLAVNVWTVDDPPRIAELAAWGVDGIITNRPAAARRALGR